MSDHSITEAVLARPEYQVTVLGSEFTAFFREAYPKVARALGLTLGDVDLGADAASEAMARCYAHWPNVKHYDNPAGWAYRVGLNWAMSLRRRLARRSPYATATVTEQPPVADPQISAAIKQLPIAMRSVVVCRFFLDWSVNETAEALAIRPGTVKSRAHRALQRLEVSLGDLR